MQDLRFDWDQRKSLHNRRKHGVSFEEAETVFLDEQALLLHDPDHSASEDRFILLGLSSPTRILLVCHCYRAEGDVIRLISARRATSAERKKYMERWRR